VGQQEVRGSKTGGLVDISAPSASILEFCQNLKFGRSTCLEEYGLVGVVLETLQMQGAAGVAEVPGKSLACGLQAMLTQGMKALRL